MGTAVLPSCPPESTPDTELSHELEPHPSLDCWVWGYSCTGSLSCSGVGRARHVPHWAGSWAGISGRDQWNSLRKESHSSTPAELWNRTALSPPPSAEILQARTHPGCVGDGVFGMSSFSGFSLLQPRSFHQKDLIIWGSCKSMV